MRKGDLVVPWSHCTVTETKEPTFFSRGRSREWIPGQIATIFAESTREIRGNHVLKFQILLDGELWWTGAGAARLLEPNETR
jgi:hypothetical protein